MQSQKTFHRRDTEGADIFALGVYEVNSLKVSDCINDTIMAIAG
jgi:hypothetical protein